MPFAEEYLKHNHFSSLFIPGSKRKPGIIIIIPCYNEPNLLESLESLYKCKRPEAFTEIIVVINHPENAPSEARQQNEKSLHEARCWVEQHNSEHLFFEIIYTPDLPVKNAGVGFARKTGMDEAVARFNAYDYAEGIIVGFDADSTCDDNYLREIELAFSDPGINGASIYYEHPVEGEDFPPLIYTGSILYELHLRYLNQAMRYTGFPYAYHTVGSSFAVRASAYVKQGGMNKRKAGEDFHFLHKIIPLGNYVEINTTRVIPSPRISDRVPFGTGASMRRFMNDGEQALYTYPIEPFRDLKELFSLIPEFYRSDINNMALIDASLPDPLQDFLKQNNYIHHINIAKQNSASLETFTKRFFGWFGGLQIVKYLNYSCLGHYEKQPANKAALSLLLLSGHKNLSVQPRDLLFAYRELERKIT